MVICYYHISIIIVRELYLNENGGPVEVEFTVYLDRCDQQDTELDL